MFKTCQAITMAITIVLPDPVAIFEHNLKKSPPSPGISTPCFSAGDASASQMRVSIASSWQKKKRRPSRCSGSCQCSKRRLVMPVTPG